MHNKSIIMNIGKRYRNVSLVLVTNVWDSERISRTDTSNYVFSISMRLVLRIEYRSTPRLLCVSNNTYVCALVWMCTAAPNVREHYYSCRCVYTIIFTHHGVKRSISNLYVLAMISRCLIFLMKNIQHCQ